MHVHLAGASRLWISMGWLVGAITFLALTAPVAATAQQARRVPRVGVLAEGTRDPSRASASLTRFEDGLREHGYVPGTNVALEVRFAGHQLDRLGELAAELVRVQVDVVVAFSERGAMAVRQATTTMPIVMVLGVDPVRRGLIDTLARPGRNVTGLTVDPSPEIIGKRLQLLREIVPGVRSVALLTESIPEGKPERFKPLEEAAQRSGVSLIRFEVRRPEELASTFAAISKSGARAILVSGASLLYFARRDVTALALKHTIPAIYPLRDYVEAGGLISYGVDFLDLSRRAAGYVARILKGAKPGDLPVEQPTKFELVINLRTAKALGVAIPQSLLMRMDQIIE